MLLAIGGARHRHRFSAIGGDLLDAEISSVAVYTDRAHWCRAAAVGHIILGARDTLLGVCGGGGPSSESCLRILRDVGRALCYVVTGFDGRSFAARAASRPRPTCPALDVAEVSLAMARERICSSR